MIMVGHARFEQICKKSRPFCRDEWILRVRELSGRVPRGLYAIWDPFFNNKSKIKKFAWPVKSAPT